MYKLLQTPICLYTIPKTYLSTNSHLLNSLPSYYQLLGINSNATEKEIRNAFKQKSLQCHPDKFPDDINKETEFKAISEAYTVLSDSLAKVEYDQRHFGAFNNKDGVGKGNSNSHVDQDLLKRADETLEEYIQRRKKARQTEKKKSAFDAHQRSYFQRKYAENQMKNQQKYDRNFNYHQYEFKASAERASDRNQRENENKEQKFYSTSEEIFQDFQRKQAESAANEREKRAQNRKKEASSRSSSANKTDRSKDYTYTYTSQSQHSTQNDTQKTKNQETKDPFDFKNSNKSHQEKTTPKNEPSYEKYKAAIYLGITMALVKSADSMWHVPDKKSDEHLEDSIRANRTKKYNEEIRTKRESGEVVTDEDEKTLKKHYTRQAKKVKEEMEYEAAARAERQRKKNEREIERRKMKEDSQKKLNQPMKTMTEAEYLALSKSQKQELHNSIPILSVDGSLANSSSGNNSSLFNKQQEHIEDYNRQKEKGLSEEELTLRRLRHTYKNLSDEQFVRLDPKTQAFLMMKAYEDDQASEHLNKDKNYSPRRPKEDLTIEEMRMKKKKKLKKIEDATANEMGETSVAAKNRKRLAENNRPKIPTGPMKTYSEAEYKSLGREQKLNLIRSFKADGQPDLFMKQHAIVEEGGGWGDDPKGWRQMSKKPEQRAKEEEICKKMKERGLKHNPYNFDKIEQEKVNNKLDYLRHNYKKLTDEEFLALENEEKAFLLQKAAQDKMAWSALNEDKNYSPRSTKDLTQDEIEKGVQAYLKRTNQFPYNKKAIEKAEKTRQTRRERVEREKNLMQLEDTTDE